jgi:ring-1,2-phenylacetyl-CoA epoxidase subunit PaaB
MRPNRKIENNKLRKQCNGGTHSAETAERIPPKPRNTLRRRAEELFNEVKIENMSQETPLWEVFIRSKNGLEHRHCGSLHAEDAEMAMNNARDVYTRRNEGVSIWVVESNNITASSPEASGELFEPATDKVYRHPTFYELPDELKHM